MWARHAAHDCRPCTAPCRCIKTKHTCEKGLTLSGTKCCESCPSNCHQENGYCYAP